ncbi:unnamed protein product [Gordionus sp. m RMFG-2023]|uniref:uncharacterized protein LOC135923284 isoform X2 n=1 Tax=Gordionus sp. m RMFG-2023 TaxID=3053472 RepID=UPI0030E0DDDF
MILRFKEELFKVIKHILWNFNYLDCNYTCHTACKSNSFLPCEPSDKSASTNNVDNFQNFTQEKFHYAVLEKENCNGSHQCVKSQMAESFQIDDNLLSSPSWQHFPDHHLNQDTMQKTVFIVQEQPASNLAPNVSINIMQSDLDTNDFDKVLYVREQFKKNLIHTHKRSNSESCLSLLPNNYRPPSFTHSLLSSVHSSRTSILSTANYYHDPGTMLNFSSCHSLEEPVRSLQSLNDLQCLDYDEIMTHSYVSFDRADDTPILEEGVDNSYDCMHLDPSTPDSFEHDDSSVKKGSKGLYITIGFNLLRPINVLTELKHQTSEEIINTSLRFDHQQMDQSMNSIDDSGYDGVVCENAAAEYSTFFLPSNITKSIFITEKTTALNVIIKFLFKFRIVDNPRKFYLHEKKVSPSTGKVYLRKIADTEKLYYIADMHRLTSVHKSKSEDCAHIPDTAFVLKDHIESEILWDSFSIPELHNFVKILDQEEKVSIDNIKKTYLKKYQALKQLMTV